MFTLWNVINFTEVSEVNFSTPGSKEFAKTRWEIVSSVYCFRPTSIAHLGFSTGHMTTLLLASTLASNATVVSFDFCEEKYKSAASLVVRNQFDQRHVLVSGNTYSYFLDIIGRICRCM